MATAQLGKVKDAQYHMLQATAEWAAFVQGMMDEATNTVAARARVVAQRKRATTYAKGELGGH